MDDKSVKYFLRDTNAAIMPAMFGRERIGTDREHITITDPETDAVLYNFFNRYHSPKPPLEDPDDIEARPKSKSSGNHPTYVKLYISEVHKFPKAVLSYEYAGMCMHLSTYIEWHDGSLVIGTGKRKRFMQLKDITKVLNISDSTARRLISKLLELKIIFEADDSYRTTGNLFAKGRSIPCESNLKKE